MLNLFWTSQTRQENQSRVILREEAIVSYCSAQHRFFGCRRRRTRLCVAHNL